MDAADEAGASVDASPLIHVFYVLRSHEWEPNYGNGLMLEEERSSFESGVSRRLQGQQGLRRPESFKRGCRESEQWRGSEEAKGTERSRSIPLGRGSRGGSGSSSNG